MLTIEEPPPLELDFAHRATAIRWKREQDVVYQIQLFLGLPDRTLVVTGSGLAGSRADVDALIQELARSFVVRVE